MPTVKRALTTANWWVGPGTHMEDPKGGPDKVVSWCVYGGLDERGYSRTIGEFESKTLADHVAKTHNRAVRNR